MTAQSESAAKKEIKALLNQINRAWVSNRTDEIAPFFHEAMVIVAPDFEVRGEGRDACVQSYKDFCVRARIIDFKA